VAECGGKDNLMTLETCKEVSDLFAVLVADAPRECKVSSVSVWVYIYIRQCGEVYINYV